MFQPSNLIAAFLFGAVGFGAWRYGKSMGLWKPFAIGIALMMYPIFTPWPWVTWSVGLALCAILWFHHDE